MLDSVFLVLDHVVDDVAVDALDTGCMLAAAALRRSGE